MKVKIIRVPLTKSPLPDKGRIGRQELQDWYRGLVRAAMEAKLNPHIEIWVVSALRIGDLQSEADLYHETLLKLGVPEHQIKVIREGYETIGQVEFVDEHVLTTDNVTFIVAPTHYFRVLWLTRKMRIEVEIGWGLPRIAEAITDCVFTFLFPIIDLCGKRDWFKKLVLSRREHGNQF